MKCLEQDISYQLYQTAVWDPWVDQWVPLWVKHRCLCCTHHSFSSCVPSAVTEKRFCPTAGAEACTEQDAGCLLVRTWFIRFSEIRYTGILFSCLQREKIIQAQFFFSTSFHFIKCGELWSYSCACLLVINMWIRNTAYNNSQVKEYFRVLFVFIMQKISTCFFQRFFMVIRPNSLIASPSIPKNVAAS